MLLNQCINFQVLMKQYFKYLQKVKLRCCNWCVKSYEHEVSIVKKQVGFLQIPGCFTVGEHITQQIDAVSYSIY